MFREEERWTAQRGIWHLHLEGDLRHAIGATYDERKLSVTPLEDGTFDLGAAASIIIVHLSLAEGSDGILRRG